MKHRAAIVASLLLVSGIAAADAQQGVVESATSRWQSGMIVTDLVVRGDDGSRMTVVEEGGSVDGVGMSVSDSASLTTGDKVSITRDRTGLRAHRAAGLARHSLQHQDQVTTNSGAGVQRTLGSGKPLYHPSGCLAFEMDAKGSAKVDNEWAAWRGAFAAWETNTENMACGGVTFMAVTVDNAPEGRDGVNTIHFRDTTWCQPATNNEAEMCHDPSAVAVTRVLYIDEPWNDRDGEILEVDIDVNAVDFTLATDGRANAIDLQAAATHELGHALGLDHNCGVEDGVWPAYRDGTAVPSCESAPADLVSATMYVQVQPGSLAMRNPKASDTAQICEMVNGDCSAPLEGGCNAGGSTGIGSVLLLGLASLLRRRK
ncbi:MAG TPA: matrixin family metalloprotease [Kofleriaceae bacterium]